MQAFPIPIQLFIFYFLSIRVRFAILSLFCTLAVHNIYHLDIDGSWRKKNSNRKKSSLILNIEKHKTKDENTCLNKAQKPGKRQIRRNVRKKICATFQRFLFIYHEHKSHINLKLQKRSRNFNKIQEIFASQFSIEFSNTCMYFFYYWWFSSSYDFHFATHCLKSICVRNSYFGAGWIYLIEEIYFLLLLFSFAKKLWTFFEQKVHFNVHYWWWKLKFFCPCLQYFCLLLRREIIERQGSNEEIIHQTSSFLILINVCKKGIRFVCIHTWWLLWIKQFFFYWSSRI